MSKSQLSAADRLYRIAEIVRAAASRGVPAQTPEASPRKVREHISDAEMRDIWHLAVGEEPWRAAEAFCLMSYRCKACGHRELLWNSRDGVTPFCISCVRCGETARHIDWEKDIAVPGHEPKPGDRIFVDLTAEKMREYKRQMVDTYWDADMGTGKMSARWETKEQAVDDLVSDFDPACGEPDVVVVKEDGSW